MYVCAYISLAVKEVLRYDLAVQISSCSCALRGSAMYVHHVAYTYRFICTCRAQKVHAEAPLSALALAHPRGSSCTNYARFLGP